MADTCSSDIGIEPCWLSWRVPGFVTYISVTQGPIRTKCVSRTTRQPLGLRALSGLNVLVWLSVIDAGITGTTSVSRLKMDAASKKAKIATNPTPQIVTAAITGTKTVAIRCQICGLFVRGSRRHQSTNKVIQQPKPAPNSAMISRLWLKLGGSTNQKLNNGPTKIGELSSSCPDAAAAAANPNSNSPNHQNRRRNCRFS